ncbi:hypothetical protein AVEN_243303-1 [Araneus ventricosus]|uniref:JmjC domain-containing protein n=1 Tax=Araneus ventricosus TaxID=182803 RepID=A0A4Y2I2W3_ARAVE|nr:hypothetical protein AVEN_243303-1 [Araneus ventricosus]
MDNALIQVKGSKHAVLFPPTDALNLYLNGDKSEVLDIENPDFDRFPRFRNVSWHECCLLPGDVLHIPGKYPLSKYIGDLDTSGSLD